VHNIFGLKPSQAREVYNSFVHATISQKLSRHQCALYHQNLSEQPPATKVQPPAPKVQPPAPKVQPPGPKVQPPAPKVTKQPEKLPEVMSASLAPVTLPPSKKNAGSMVVAVAETPTVAENKKKEAESLYVLAQQFKEEKRYVAAITSLDSAVERNPYDAKFVF
jgi:hypothetical protein